MGTEKQVTEGRELEAVRAAVNASAERKAEQEFSTELEKKLHGYGFVELDMRTETLSESQLQRWSG